MVEYQIKAVGRCWVVTNGGAVCGVYDTHCQATLQAMLLAHISGRGGQGSQVVLYAQGQEREMLWTSCRS